MKNKDVIRKQYDEYMNDNPNYTKALCVDDLLVLLDEIETVIRWEEEDFEIQRILSNKKEFDRVQCKFKDPEYRDALDLYWRMSHYSNAKQNKYPLKKSALGKYNFNDYINKLVKNGVNGTVYVSIEYRKTKGKVIPGLEEVIRYEVSAIKKFVETYHEVFFGNERVYFPDELKVVLSDEKKYRSYGKYTEHEIVENIKNIITGVNQNGDSCCLILNEIKNILLNRKINSILNGEYDSRSQEIVIYYETLDSKNGKDRYLAELRKVLAHEILHFLHHLYIRHYDFVSFSDNSKEATAVKEALADYFCFLYCLNESSNVWGNEVLKQSINVVHERYNSWRNLLGSAWPYANAILLANPEHLFKDAHGNYTKEFTDDFNYYMNDDWFLRKHPGVWVESGQDFVFAYERLNRPEFI